MPTVSWETHYVGSIRAIRSQQLDGYLLKSLDIIDLPATHQVGEESMILTRCVNKTKICIWRLSNKGRMVQLGTYNKSNEGHLRVPG